MVKAVRIYVEGDNELREGFSSFFGELRDLARSRSCRWEIILCGPRDRAYRSFKRAFEDHPDALNILLVDSEGPVTNGPWKHLKSRPQDRWEPCGDNSNCHLMVQVMESWFIADVSTLEKFYGPGFNRNPIPKDQDVEQLEKEQVLRALDEAVRHVSTRGKSKYHKTKHPPELLKLLSPAKVRKASKHCDRLFSTIVELIDPPSKQTDPSQMPPAAEPPSA